MTVNLTNPIFKDEIKAREHLEALRWPDGAYCPRCGQTETVKKLGGKAADLGVTVAELLHQARRRIANVHRWPKRARLARGLARGLPGDVGGV